MPMLPNSVEEWRKGQGVVWKISEPFSGVRMLLDSHDVVVSVAFARFLFRLHCTYLCGFLSGWVCLALGGLVVGLVCDDFASVEFFLGVVEVMVGVHVGILGLLDRAMLVGGVRWGWSALLVFVVALFVVS